jgi:hypothetical protein
VDGDEPRIFVMMSPSPQPDVKQFRSLIFDQHTGQLLRDSGREKA